MSTTTQQQPTPDYGEPWHFQFIPHLEFPGGNCLDRDFKVTVLYRPELSSERIQFHLPNPAIDSPASLSPVSTERS